MIKTPSPFVIGFKKNNKASALGPAPYKVFRRRLHNGLRVCAIETPHLHTAVVALYVRTGSRYESAKNNGLSHFLEHMIFRGSPKHPTSFELNTAVEDLGGTLYAETGRDYSMYQIALGWRGVSGALEILGDLFSAPVFSEIDSEKRLVLEEILEDFDERGQMVNTTDLVRAAAFGDHPLGQSIVGPAANVKGFSVADVRRHFRRFYNPANMILCVGGPLDTAEVFATVKRSFADLPPGREAKAKVAPAWGGGPKIKTVTTDSSQSQIQIAFGGVATPDPDHPALVALMRLIDDGMATPLHYRIADQKGLAYTVSADNESFFDTSLVEFDAACSPSNLAVLVDEIFDIVDGFRRQEVDAALLDRAKRRYNDDLEASYDDVGSLCSWFGGAELFMKPFSHAQRLRQMNKVSAADIQRVARRVFDRRRMTVVVTGQFDRKELARVKKAVRAF